MTRRAHILLAAGCAAVLAFLGGSLILPSGVELVRHRDLPYARAEIHPWVADPTRWSRWAPPWMSAAGPAEERARITAAPPDRGVWWDLPAVGPRLAKSALLYGSDETGTPGAQESSTRLTWILRTDVGLDPLRRWTSLLRRGRLERQMDGALARLEQALE